MKPTSIIAIATLVATAGLAMGKPKQLPADTVVAQAMKMEAAYRTRLAEKPRKLSIQFLKAGNLLQRDASRLMGACGK